MSELLKMQQTNPGDAQKEKYFSFQIKGWLNFDPMDKPLAKVAEGIEQGDGFLTMVEVLKVEDDVSSIGDEEARACFENLLAARMLVRNIDQLPARVKEELRAALKSEDEVLPKKMVTRIPGSSPNQEMATVSKRWP
jgi:hypothetical protein